MLTDPDVLAGAGRTSRRRWGPMSRRPQWLRGWWRRWRGWRGRWRSALFLAVPGARVAVLRPVIYLFVVCDVFWIVDDVIPHSQAPDGLYRPMLLRRLLHLPVPEPGYTQSLRVVIVVAALVAASGRLPRLSGTVVALGFLDWVSMGMSYSKVDHDHFGLVVALFVLPTVGVARFGDRQRSEAAGWALLAVQCAVVATYFLSALAKMRFGTTDWANGSVFAWAMTRRGTPWGKALLEPPWLLQAGQWGLLVLEFLSPLLLLLAPRLTALGRWRYAGVVIFTGFHLASWLLLKIHFLPLVVCLLAFLPLERLVRRERESAAATTPVDGTHDAQEAPCPTTAPPTPS